MMKMIFELQNDLNVKTTGLQNYATLNMTAKNRPIDYCRELSLELAELLESTPHKHWKDVNKLTFDRANAFVENIDMMHFFTSAIIQLMAKHSNLTMDLITISLSNVVLDARADIDRVLANIENDDNIVAKMTSMYFKINKAIMPIRDAIHSKEMTKSFITTESGIATICKLFKYLYRMYLVSTYNPETLEVKTYKEFYTGYITKNVLNKFRQDFKYDKGLYEKYWITEVSEDPVEDNVVAFDIAMSMSELTSKELYTKLLNPYYLTLANKSSESRELLTNFMAYAESATVDTTERRHDDAVSAVTAAVDAGQVGDFLRRSNIALCGLCGTAHQVAEDDDISETYVCRDCSVDV